MHELLAYRDPLFHLTPIRNAILRFIAHRIRNIIGLKIACGDSNSKSLTDGNFNNIVILGCFFGDHQKFMSFFKAGPSGPHLLLEEYVYFIIPGVVSFYYHRTKT